MTWEQVAAPHLNHKAFLKSLYELRCVDCAMTLVIHKEPRAVAVTGPPPYRYRPPEQPASPELIALKKREVEAALRLAREKRTSATEEPA